MYFHSFKEHNMATLSNYTSPGNLPLLAAENFWDAPFYFSLASGYGQAIDITFECVGVMTRRQSLVYLQQKDYKLSGYNNMKYTLPEINAWWNLKAC